MRGGTRDVTLINNSNDMRRELESDAMKVRSSFFNIVYLLEQYQKTNNAYLLSGVFFPCIDEMLCAFFRRDDKLNR
jgi:hypothetical protein